MDAGTLTRIRQMRELYAAYRRDPRHYYPAGQPVVSLVEAPMTQFVARQPVVAAADSGLVRNVFPQEQGFELSAVAVAVGAVKSFLQWLTGSGLGPTHIARRIYMFSMLIGAAWNWVAPVTMRRLEGVKDGWDWNAGIGLRTETQRAVWLAYIVSQQFGSITGGATIEGWDMEGWNVEAVLAAGRAVEFTAAWAAWLAGRAADGSAGIGVAAPTAEEVVNKELQIETASGVLPAFADPGRWTPLKLPMKPAKQGYLTFHWGDVRGTGLTGEQEGDIRTAAAVFFPDEVERAAEVAEVVGITAGLTDREKCTAEWWAGGPGTVAPPGMCLWWWKEVMEGGVREDVCMMSLLDLGIHLFEASRLVWGLKAAYVQARPIQEIRWRYAGMTLTGYDGEAQTGDLWMPYQEADFVTPPFADFPSGHSCFSQMGALVMTAWFGAAVPTGVRRREDLGLICPIMGRGDGGRDSIEGPFNAIRIPAGHSHVQAGVVPAADVVLEWNTWQEMADSSGLSRLYGGIHCMSAHTSSQHVAVTAHEFLDDVWGIRRV